MVDPQRIPQSKYVPAHPPVRLQTVVNFLRDPIPQATKRDEVVPHAEKGEEIEKFWFGLRKGKKLKVKRSPHQSV